MPKRPIRKVDLMLDSGVFSAWNRGQSLHLGDYIEYVKEVKDYLFCYVNMDKIPGEFGRRRSKKEIDESASVSYDNHKTMRAAGLSPVPVFHQGEEISWLERMLDDGEKYIGISTAKDLPLSAHVQWLNKIFTILTNAKGWPIVKTHGFGITRPNLVMRYPWYSCDSTTWTLTPGFGQIWVPTYKNGEPDYNTPPMQVVLSDKLRVTSTMHNRFELLGNTTEPWVLDFFKRAGVTLEQATYVPDRRRQIMLYYFVEFHKARSLVPFAYRSGSLVDRMGFGPNAKVQKWDRVNIMLATNLSRSWSILMNDIGANQRLLSYYELMTRPTAELIEYVTTGKVGQHTKQKPRANWRAHYQTHRRMSLLQRMTTTENEDAQD